MASVQWKSSVNTTERKLKTFFGQNIFFAFLLAVATIIFCVLSNARYEESGSRQLELHDFYRQLESLHSGLTAYITKGNQEVVPLADGSLENLRRSVEVLQGLRISAVYQRDISDVAGMLERYGAWAGEVLSSGQQEARNQAYYEAEAVYKAINDEFRSLNYQILEYTCMMTERLEVTQKLYVMLMGIFIVFMTMADVVYSVRLSRGIVDPIEELTSSIRGYSFKNLADYNEVVLHSTSNEEMNILVGVFNTMLRTIKGQMEKIREHADIEIRLHQKEVENLQMTNLLRTSELKALQMQINPHFLFNTLNMISQTAYVEGADETSLLLDSTASLLRYALDFAVREVPLWKEIENLGTYVSLLEHRFAGRIHFTFDLDESFHDIMVPALILQPLVENAITHGVGMYLKDGQVTIRTEYDSEKNQGIIRITDNGVGMEEEELKQIREEMRQQKNAEQKLGLSNVCARLRIFFRDRANVEIRSGPDRGTQIAIVLPCDRNLPCGKDTQRAVKEPEEDDRKDVR